MGLPCGADCELTCQYCAQMERLVRGKRYRSFCLSFEKSFLTLTTGVSAYKLFSFFDPDDECKQARAFVPDKSFQSVLIFSGKTESLDE